MSAFSKSCSSSSTPVVIHEGNLTDICNLLAADRFEVVDAQVTFDKHLAPGVVAHWTGYLGDQIALDGSQWCISTGVLPETTWASVA